MKKIAVLLLILPLLLFCGFKKAQKPYIVVSVGTINAQTIQRVERFFNVNQRVNYALFIPEMLKFSGVRLQISKQDEKASNWGFSIVETRDIYIPQGDKCYRGYIVPRTKGHYIIQFFYLNKKNYPFAHKEFIVQ